MLGPASPAEAAAIVSAVERFLSETSPVPAPGDSRASPWQRAALLEGTSARDAFASPWGEPRTWGARHSHLP